MSIVTKTPRLLKLPDGQTIDLNWSLEELRKQKMFSHTSSTVWLGRKQVICSCDDKVGKFYNVFFADNEEEITAVSLVNNWYAEIKLYKKRFWH